MAFRRSKTKDYRRKAVVPWTPVQRLVSVIGLAAAVAAAAATGYLLGVRQFEFDRSQLGALGERIRALEFELESSSQQLADASLAREIDRQALAIQREEMADLRQTVGELREQLAFYRNLMETSSPEQNLQVANFELLGAQGPNTYGFRLLLIQRMDQADWISGDVEMDVTGLRGGEEQLLAWSKMTDADPYPLRFRFRYVQRLSGSLTLPDGFRPLLVTVRLSSSGERAVRVERTFAWPDASSSNR